MVRQLRTWLRTTLPTELAIGLIALLWCGLFALCVALEFAGARGVWDGYARLLVVCCYLLSVIYAICRVAYFNPIEHTKYGRWLIDTPWSFPDRLPLGPLHLSWQDVLIVGLLVAIFPKSRFDVWPLLAVFMGMYSLGISASLCRIGIYWPAYAGAALAGLFLLILPPSPWAVVFAGVWCLVANFGQREMLRAFPFSTAERDRLKLGARRQETESPAGWPVPPTARERYRWQISHAHALGVSMSLAWLLYCVCIHSPKGRDEPPLAAIFGYQVALPVVAVRCWLYLWGYAPPISLLGRIFRGRLVIPSYDIALLAIACALAALFGLPTGLMRFGCPEVLAYIVSVGISIWITLAFPPRREAWIYTGGHRICYRILATKEESSAARRRRQSFRLLR